MRIYNPSFWCTSSKVKDVLLLIAVPLLYCLIFISSTRLPLVRGASDSSDVVPSPTPVPLADAYRRIGLKRLVLDPTRYDRNMPPRGYRDFTNVTIELLLESISQVDELAEKIFPMFYGYTRWTDPRLAFNPDEWGDERMIYYLDEIWTPTIFYWTWTDRGSLLIIEKSHSFQALVDHTGHVILPLVITKPVMCPFNAWKFPFDSQRCLVFFYADIIESLHALEITEDAIDMPEVGEWKVKNFYVKEAATIRDFSFVKQFNNYTKAKYATDQYSMVSFIIELDRSYVSHILIWILPCNAMALVGFIGLFMGSNLHTKQLPFGGSIMVAEAVFLIGLSNRLPVGSKKFPILGYYYVITFCLIGAALCSSLLLGRRISILVPFYHHGNANDDDGEEDEDKVAIRRQISNSSVWGSLRQSLEQQRNNHSRRHRKRRRHRAGSSKDFPDDELDQPGRVSSNAIDDDGTNQQSTNEDESDDEGRNRNFSRRRQNSPLAIEDIEMHEAMSVSTLKNLHAGHQQQHSNVCNAVHHSSPLYMRPVTTAATSAQYRRYDNSSVGQVRNRPEELRKHPVAIATSLPNGGPYVLQQRLHRHHTSTTDADAEGRLPVTTFNDIMLFRTAPANAQNLQPFVQDCTCGHMRPVHPNNSAALATSAFNHNNTHIHSNNLMASSYLSKLPYHLQNGSQVTVSSKDTTKANNVASKRAKVAMTTHNESYRSAIDNGAAARRYQKPSRSGSRRNEKSGHFFTSRGLLALFLGLQILTTLGCTFLWLSSPELHP